MFAHERRRDQWKFVRRIGNRAERRIINALQFVVAVKRGSALQNGVIGSVRRADNHLRALSGGSETWCFRIFAAFLFRIQNAFCNFTHRDLNALMIFLGRELLQIGFGRQLDIDADAIGVFSRFIN
jgi:hypothetical protein